MPGVCFIGINMVEGGRQSLKLLLTCNIVITRISCLTSFYILQTSSGGDSLGI